MGLDRVWVFSYGLERAEDRIVFQEIELDRFLGVTGLRRIGETLFVGSQSIVGRDFGKFHHQLIIRVEIQSIYTQNLINLHFKFEYNFNNSKKYIKIC